MASSGVAGERTSVPSPFSNNIFFGHFFQPLLPGCFTRRRRRIICVKHQHVRRNTETGTSILRYRFRRPLPMKFSLERIFNCTRSSSVTVRNLMRSRRSPVTNAHYSRVPGYESLTWDTFSRLWGILFSAFLNTTRVRFKRALFFEFWV